MLFSRQRVYLRDPDGNGVELYWDRPRELPQTAAASRPTRLWPRTPEGGIAMYTRALDLEGLLKEE